MCKNDKYINIQTGEELDLVKVDRLKDNAMLKVKPELWVEWDFKKNDELGYDIWKVSQGSNKEVYWTCLKCNSQYHNMITDRVNRDSKCSYCSGRKVNHTNSLSSLNTILASEWHPSKNGNLTPHNFTCHSSEKVWWLGKCGHEWEARITNRSRGNGCPYCANKKLLVGFNDMWTTNPELAGQLANPEDGYRYMQRSRKKVDWRCSNCNTVVKNKNIFHTYYQGLSCPNCSDGFSYPEKFIYNLLTELKVEFYIQVRFEWSDNRKYDFYIKTLNALIEVHGKQHYDKGFESFGGRSLEEERENDKLKENLANHNGIKDYIVIDARFSELDWIKNSILNSKLSNLLNLRHVDWDKINENAMNSLVKVACILWNNGLKSTTVIGEKMKLSRSTIVRYLKMGSKIKWCDYDPRKVSINNGKNAWKSNIIPIIQLSLDSKLIREWVSMSKASDITSVNKTSISSCCRGKYKTAGGFKWMYKEDYKKYIEEQKQLA